MRENRFFRGFEWRELVLDYDRRIERGEVDLMDLFVDSRFRLKDHASLVRRPQFGDVPNALSISFPEGHSYDSPKSLKHLVRGDERPRSEA